MGSIKNDMYMQTVFRSELALVPRWLRLTKPKLVTAFIAEAALLAMIYYALTPGINMIVSSKVLLAVLIPVSVLPALWFFLAFHKGFAAYRTAAYIAEYKRMKENRFARNHWDYCDKRDEYAPAVYQKARFCPSCGLLLMAGENKCKSCGKLRRWAA